MLQKVATQHSKIDAMDSDAASLRAGIANLQHLIKRQYPIVFSVVLAALAAGGLYVLTSPKQYTSTASLIIDSRKVNLLQQTSPSTEMPIESAMIDSQVQILKSETIALSVIKDLHLAEDNEFNGLSSSLFTNFIGSISGFLSAGSPPPSDYVLARRALQNFQSKLTVKRAGLSYVIEISYQSLSPSRAAQIANAIAEAYIVDTLESKYQASRRASVWLQERLKELRYQASASERAVADYKAQNNIVDAGGRLLSDQQLAELNSSMTVARTQRAEAEARLARITNILEGDAKAESGSVLGSPLIDGLATVTDTLNNQVIVKLRQQFLDLSQREADWRNRYGPSHQAVANLRNQMREIKRSIADELRRIAETYKSDAEIARAREASAERNLADAVTASNGNSQAQIVLRDLESNSQSTRSLADNFLNLYMVSVQQQSFPITEARLITPATMPLGASSPKTNLVLLISLGAGFLLGGIVGFVRELMDQVIRSTSQIERTLGLTCIANVPIVPDRRGLPTRPASDRRSGSRLQKLLGTTSFLTKQKHPKQPESAGGVQKDVATVVLTEPFSKFSEAIRSAKMAIDLHAMDSTAKIIGMTSALPNEGKSTISKALAYASAKSGARTLLIDADIRNPSITRQLRPNAQVGLTEVILGSAQIADILIEGLEPNLDFVPSNTKIQFPNSADLLASSQTQKLFQDLRPRYDRIFVDLSPLFPVIDVRGTGGIVDGYLFVIEWAQTKLDAVERALIDAPAVHNQLIGTVLNKVNPRALAQYDGYRRYYNDKYQDRYGYTD